MAYYVFANIEITDAERYKDYVAGVRPVLEAAGGKYLARGGDASVVEGAFTPHRLVLLEWPTKAAWDAFYASPAYAPLLAIRHQSTNSTMVGFSGL